MNYLGHAVLSFRHPDILCGNMMGDFVKGTPSHMDIYPEGIKNGLILHRHIDTFTDQHEAIREAKKIFRAKYGLFSGAVVDTLMDHFVANDADLFAQEADLHYFVQEVYQQLGAHSHHFPASFIPYYQSMLRHNWLFHYRSEYGVQQSLQGLLRKAKRIDEVETAFRLLQENKNELQEMYQVFIKDIISFVKIEIANH